MLKKSYYWCIKLYMRNRKVILVNIVFLWNHYLLGTHLNTRIVVSPIETHFFSLKYLELQSRVKLTK